MLNYLAFNGDRLVRILLDHNLYHINMMLYSVLCFVGVIMLVVVVHEFGHYVFARACGVRVLEFAVGFGKTIVSFRDRHNTEWQIRALPIGGYVKMHGDQDPAGVNIKDISSVGSDDKTAFCNKKLWQKFLIVVAGPLFNYVLAIVLYTAVACCYGIVVMPTVIGNLTKDSPAYKAGLRMGDMILELNDKRVNTFIDVKREIMLSQQDELLIKAARKNKIIVLAVKPEIKYIDGKMVKLIGISGIEVDKKQMSIWNAFCYGVRESYNISAVSLRALKQVIVGDRSPRELGGPIKIASHSAEAGKQGIISLILFSAFISINLGLMNLLPIPVLDGGHLFFYTTEALIGRPIPQVFYKILSYAGMVIIGILMLFTVANDLISLFR